MTNRPISNIGIRALLGVPKHANQHRLSRLTMEVHTDELRIMTSPVESYTDELIAALEAADKRIAELEAREVTPEVGVMNIGNPYCEDRLVAWTVAGKSLPPGIYYLAAVRTGSLGTED